MKRIQNTFGILFFLATFFSLEVKADSPLTSTPFYTAYPNQAMVKIATEAGLSKKVLKYLDGKAEFVDKLIVLNALGWGNTENIKTYEAFLLKKYKKLKPSVFDYLKESSEDAPVENEQTKILSADELSTWAYILTMGDYFQPNFGMRASYFAYARESESMAHSVVFTLIAAQKSFDESWCRIFQICQVMLRETVYQKNLLSTEALKIILDYTDLYQADCGE